MKKLTINLLNRIIENGIDEDKFYKNLSNMESDTLYKILLKYLNNSAETKNKTLSSYYR